MLTYLNSGGTVLVPNSVRDFGGEVNVIEEKDILNSKILIIDDEPANGAMLEMVLKHDGFTRIQITSSPLESVAIYEETRPDLVLLDLRMPGMDGFDVLEAIRKIERDYCPPVIILTAESDPEIRIKALRAGAKDFLSKPLNLTEVLCRCRNILEMKLLQNQLVEKKDKMQQMVRDRTAELWTTNALLREEIAEREEIQNWLKKQNELLEMVGQGGSLADCISHIRQFWKAFSESAACIHLLNKDEKSFHVGYNWGLSREFAAKLDDLSLKGEPTSFGLAVERGETVIDIFPEPDPFENEYSQQLMKEGYATVWSTPIHGRENRILGALNLYFDEPRSPEKMDRAWVDLVCQLAGIVLERGLAEEKLNRVHSQLLHSEKLAAMGKLSASISHEFNNPILGIRNVLEQVSREKALDDGLQELSLLAIDECSRVMKLATRLREFFRPSTGVAEAVDLEKAVEDMVLLKENDLNKKGIELNRSYESGLPSILAVEDQIKQVVLNLLQNAGEAVLQNVGKITVALKRAGSFVRLEIKDNGVGISQEIKNQVFEPFFTTKKDKVKGTGLGLSVSYGIVNNHGGVIEYENVEGGGTEFVVCLPVFRDPGRTALKDPLSAEEAL